MALTRLYACKICGAEQALTFAEEAAPDGSAYAGRGPVGGLRSRHWCPTCRSVQARWLVRLEPPADHPVVAYAEAQRLGLTGDESGPCPVCGTPLLADPEGAPCPENCGGALHCLGEWE